jgi:hypothetical protein
MLHNSEKIGFGRGITGVLFVTSRRLAFVKLQRKKTLLTYRYQECPENLDDALKNEGSFEVDINQILEATANTVMKTPYMRIRYNTQPGEKAFSFILPALWSSGGISPAVIVYYKIISEAIEQAKKGTLSVTSPITDQNLKSPDLISLVKDIKKARGTQSTI